MKWCATILVATLAAFFGPAYIRWGAYERTGLAPYSGGIGKDMFAFMLTSIPRFQRLFKTPASDESLEGFHETLEFNNFGKMTKFKESPHFAENFYFWGNSVQDTSFLFTIRLSFYSVNAAHVVPWFHFMIDGEAWDLPEEFENKTLPHKSGDPREANAPGLGHLKIDCLVPMKHWRINYEGLVRNMKTLERKNVKAQFDLYFNPNNVFRYQVNMDELTAARSMARKPWTASFWQNLRNQNQERYCSQADKVTGYIQFEDMEEKRDVGILDGSRDHNFGIRNWRFMHSYIWFPPVKFAEPIKLDGVEYTYFAGAMTEYGNVFDNMVVGGLMSDDGKCASWSGATHMRDIAPKWYDQESVRYKGIGEETLPGEIDWDLAVLQSKYIVKIRTERGTPKGLWSHSFSMADGVFEIHEAQTLWYFTVTDAVTHKVLQKTTAVGLFEFGKNLIGYDESV